MTYVWYLLGIAARRVHIYLALLHGVAEERVQQQVLQIGIPVERLFDFSQEDAVGLGNGDKPRYFYCTEAERDHRRANSADS